MRLSGLLPAVAFVQAAFAAPCAVDSEAQVSGNPTSVTSSITASTTEVVAGIDVGAVGSEAEVSENPISVPSSITASTTEAVANIDVIAVNSEAEAPENSISFASSVAASTTEAVSSIDVSAVNSEAEASENPTFATSSVSTSNDEAVASIDASATNSEASASENPTSVESSATASTDEAVASSDVDAEATEDLDPSALTGGAEGQINAVYYPNWARYGAKYFADDIPADEVTHVLYAFGKIDNDGTVVSSDPWADVGADVGVPDPDGTQIASNNIGDLFKLKQNHRHLKVLLSIGGWTYSQEFQFQRAVANKASMTRFATSAVRLMRDWGFDGIDIDWEYPEGLKEGGKFLELLEALRRELDNYSTSNLQSHRYLLTVASAASEAVYKDLDMPAIDKVLDTWFLMAYDYAGTWESRTGHASNIYPDDNNPDATPFNTDKVIKDYINLGVTPKKIVLGMPLYGRGFANTVPEFGNTFQGGGPGTLESGTYLYRELPQGSGTTSGTNSKVIGAWTYDEESKILISHDNPETVKLKAKYINDMGLGGAMFWDASGDKTGDDSLISVAKNALGKLDMSQNVIDYKDSLYQNIRNKSD